MKTKKISGISKSIKKIFFQENNRDKSIKKLKDFKISARKKIVYDIERKEHLFFISLEKVHYFLRIIDLRSGLKKLAFLS